MTVSLRAHEVSAETSRAIMDAQVDVTGAELVEVTWSEDRTVLWVNVNGICLLRICRMADLKVG